MALKRITLLAPAKINLSLDITGKLANGYHALEMLLQTISLQDEVILEKTPDGTAVFCDHPQVPSGDGNICDKAARLFFEKTSIPGGVKIEIRKRIPAGAGLAGGSADAAAVLKGLNSLYDAKLTGKELEDIGILCGADVPYCLTGGTCLAKGIGEKLTRLPTLQGVYTVLIMPQFSVSTAWVYQNYRMADTVWHPDTKRLVSSIRKKELPALARGMKNVLESVTTVKYPEIQGIKQDLLRCGALGSMMSGSGPAVFGLFEGEEEARAAFAELHKHYKQIWLVSTIE